MRAVAIAVAALGLAAGPGGSAMGGTAGAVPEGRAVKQVLDLRQGGPNLLEADAWRPWEKGFAREGDVFVCDNGADASVQRGVSQTVRLDQARPEPIIATAWSRAEGVGGGRNSDYSLYLDLIYSDGTPLWGQISAFDVGTHDWERAQVRVFPEKPVRSVSFHMLLRRHAGKAWFRGPELRVIRPPEGACLFDGVPVVPRASREGFQVRDAAGGSDFVRIDREALGLRLDCRTSREGEVTFYDLTLADTKKRDRAVTLVYAVPIGRGGWRWLRDPRRDEPAGPSREYVNASRFGAGATGQLSRYPLGAVADKRRGLALGIDMSRPAFFRVGANSGTGELFVAYDIGLAPEKPEARVRFCKFEFLPAWGFRAALERYYRAFPEHFRCRTPRQGLWMPFAKISEVPGWEDFGFGFKEGTNETKWDDEHGIVTFRYTEPLTWWMKMPPGLPRTLDAALAEARRLADEKGDASAKALFTSGYHDAKGAFAARLLDTPWCNGAVWSMNSMPGVRGGTTDFANKWNEGLRERLYGPAREADLDGEYVDSSEGYVTDELDFRRDHFAAADAPLCYSLEGRRPAIFRGLIAFEYVRGIERDVRAMGRLMMANSTPDRLPWLAPMLDVMGTETDWNRGGKWSPMSDADLLFRRAMCGKKPYCFLMNTRFEDFPHELVERYMKRALAYGMFPGFFSHNAAEGHYFTRPELYGRDRDLFKKYVPLCRLVAEAGWEPVTRARSSDERVRVERFGERYLAVLNDSAERRPVTISLDGRPRAARVARRELVAGRELVWLDGRASLDLEPEDVAVIELP